AEHGFREQMQDHSPNQTLNGEHRVYPPEPAGGHLCGEISAKCGKGARASFGESLLGLGCHRRDLEKKGADDAPPSRHGLVGGQDDLGDDLVASSRRAASRTRCRVPGPGAISSASSSVVRRGKMRYRVERDTPAACAIALTEGGSADPYRRVASRMIRSLRDAGSAI